MPFRPFNREQAWLLPPTLDELIPADHPVRFVAAFVDSLDGEMWEELEIDLKGDPQGAGAYHPRALLSTWLYGFMTGVRSNRKLEAACREQMPYMWLAGMQRPDHNTLWRFYMAHRDRMRVLLRRTVRTAVQAGLVDLALQAVDGTRIAANASKDRTFDAKGLERLLDRVEAAIEVSAYEPLLQRHRAVMATDWAKQLYRRRKTLVEPVFGLLKEGHGARRFLLRGRTNVLAEWSLIATAFNLKSLHRRWRLEPPSAHTKIKTTCKRPPCGAQKSRRVSQTINPILINPRPTLPTPLRCWPPFRH